MTGKSKESPLVRYFSVVVVMVVVDERGRGGVVPQLLLDDGRIGQNE